MRVCRSVASMVGMMLAAVAVDAQPRGTMLGADTPQAVVAALQQAIKSDNVAAALPYLAPAGRRELASEGVSALLMFFASANPESAMAGGPALAKAELDAKKKAYRTATDTARKALKPYGLDKAVGRPPMAPDTQQTVETALGKADTVGLMTAVMALFDRLGPALGMQKGDRPKVPFALGLVTGYKIDGDRATARAQRDTLEFERIDGRWFIRPLAASTMK